MTTELPKSFAQLTVRRVTRNKIAVVSLCVILFLTLASMFAEAIAPFPANQQSVLLHAPPGTLDRQSGRIHWMGTDDLGRDIFTRVLYGIRISVLVGIATDAAIIVIGVSIGVASGYAGGELDNLLMRVTDVMYALPSLVFAMVVVTVFGRSIPAILLAVVATNWINVARLVRGQVLQVKQMDYVLAARSIGARPTQLIRAHVLPNVLGPVIVLSTLTIPSAMTVEASLAFLGVGIDPSTPTLGVLINAARRSMLFYPGEVLFPVAALTALTLGFTLLGDGLRDALDPRA